MSERTQLEILLGEMAAQSDDDAVCKEIESQIVDKPWAQEKWRELLHENHCFRTELNNLDVPDDLETRLLSVAIPETTSPAPPTSFARFGSWGWAVAAVLLVAVCLGIVLQQRNDSRMQTVALLAISNHLSHLDDHGVKSKSREPGELAVELSELVEFDVILPDLGDRLQLVGGRKCKLGTHTVAFSLWSDKAGSNYSLFQFRPDEFGIPSSVPSQLVHTTGPAGEEHPCGAWIWADSSAGYVLVGDPGCEMKNLSPGASNGS